MNSSPGTRHEDIVAKVSEPADQAGQIDERVGLLLVHGIGEQGAFEHLENEMRDIVQGLERIAGKDKVTVQLRATRDVSPGAVRRVWAGENQSPIGVDVTYTDPETKKQKRIAFDFHEVWWADLDASYNPPTTFGKLRFWLWGLGQWLARRDTNISIEGQAYPHFPFQGATGKIPWLPKFLVRLQLFLVDCFFLMLVLTWSIAKMVIRVFKERAPSPTILVRYLGDVKLYQDRERPGSGPLEDLGKSPRDAIMRRMANAMIDMAIGYRPVGFTESVPYDRWYVLAHSLGTVVAWDGLNQTSKMLDGYLSKTNQRRAYELAMRRRKRKCQAGEIDRAWLFERFRGFCTYGSPLDKFAFLWPERVALNTERHVFQKNGLRKKDAEWINLFAPTDPVSAKLDAFSRYRTQNNEIVDIEDNFKPRNFSYNASRRLLLSHIRYLSYDDGQPEQLVERLGRWLLSNDDFEMADSGVKPTGRWIEEVQEDKKPSHRGWKALAFAQWVGAAYGLAVGFSYLVPSILGGMASTVFAVLPGLGSAATAIERFNMLDGWIGYLVLRPFLFAFAVVVIVIVSGLLLRLHELWRRHP